MTTPNHPRHARSWEDVVRDFNARNPNAPIPSANAAASLGNVAMQKIKAALIVAHRKGDI